MFSHCPRTNPLFLKVPLLQSDCISCGKECKLKITKTERLWTLPHAPMMCMTRGLAHTALGHSVQAIQQIHSPPQSHSPGGMTGGGTTHIILLFLVFLPAELLCWVLLGQMGAWISSVEFQLHECKWALWCLAGIPDTSEKPHSRCVVNVVWFLLPRVRALQDWHSLTTACTGPPTRDTGPERDRIILDLMSLVDHSLEQRRAHWSLLILWSTLGGWYTEEEAQQGAWTFFKDPIPCRVGAFSGPASSLGGPPWTPFRCHRLDHGSYLCDCLPFPHSLWVTCFLCNSCDKGH